MFDKFPILIEFYKLSDDFGQYLHYLFYDHSIRGKLSKEKKKKKNKKKKSNNNKNKNFYSNDSRT